MTKLPGPDPDRLARTPAEYAEVDDVLWRLHSPHHPDHPMRWDELRTFGPLFTARFDPWPPPPKERAPDGVAYFGRDVPTCLAEVFQETRHVNTSRGGLQLTAFTSTRRPAPARPARCVADPDRCVPPDQLRTSASLPRVGSRAAYGVPRGRRTRLHRNGRSRLRHPVHTRRVSRRTRLQPTAQ